MYEDIQNWILFIGEVLIGLIAVGGGLYFAITRRSAANIGLKLETDPRSVRRGTTLKVFMHVNPPSTVDVSEIILNLKCVRIEKKSILGGEKIEVPKVIDSIKTSIPGQILTAGVAKTIETNIDVPADVSVTNAYGDINTRWYIEVTFVIGKSRAIKDIEITIL